MEKKTTNNQTLYLPNKKKEPINKHTIKWVQKFSSVQKNILRAET